MPAGLHNFDYDLFVIGAGSGGVRAARMAAATGARVAVAEEFRVGGTCVIRGCVPKKLFVYASHFADELEDARGFGWSVGGVSFDWHALRDNTAREVARLSGIYTANLTRAGVELIQSRAVLADAHHVRLGHDDLRSGSLCCHSRESGNPIRAAAYAAPPLDTCFRGNDNSERSQNHRALEGQGRTVSAQTILIATGAAPHIPEFPGAEHVITSNEAFLLPRLPERIAIVGGGYIAVEFAGIFNGLGVEVTLIYRGAQILRGFDDDMRDGLTEAMRAKGIRVEVNRQVARIEERGGAKVAVCADGTEITADAIMYATGRRPLTAGMGLTEAGVRLGACGEIAVDEYSRSSVANIYAVGDVTDRANLTPVAIADAMCFVDTVFRGQPAPVDHRFIPTAVFSQPEIGTIGLTETQARERFAAVDIYKSSFRPMKHTLSGRSERMLMKLVVDAATDAVLGAHILGPDAAEMAQILAIPLRMGARKADFDATMALHPSAAEELVTMREKWQPPRQ